MEFGNLLTGLLVVVFIVTCAALILVVLIQRPQGGGLSGAFGGGSGSGQTAFGAKVGDVLTYATIAIFILFLLTAIGLTYAIRPSDQPAQAPGAVGGQTPAEQVPTEAPPTDPTVQNPDPDDETFDAAPPPTGDEILLPDDETEQPPADEPPADEPPADDPPANEPG
jgi:protein translocase SecG subunit